MTHIIACGSSVLSSCCICIVKCITLADKIEKLLLVVYDHWQSYDGDQITHQSRLVFCQLPFFFFSSTPSPEKCPPTPYSFLALDALRAFRAVYSFFHGGNHLSICSRCCDSLSRLEGDLASRRIFDGSKSREKADSPTSANKWVRDEGNNRGTGLLLFTSK